MDKEEEKKINKSNEKLIKYVVLIFTILLVGVGLYLTYDITINNKGKNDLSNIKRSNDDYTDAYRLVHNNLYDTSEGSVILSKYNFETSIYNNQKGLESLNNISKEAFSSILKYNYDFSKYENKLINRSELENTFKDVTYSIFGNNLEFNNNMLECNLATYNKNIDIYEFDKMCGDTSSVTALYKITDIKEQDGILTIEESVLYRTFDGIYNHFNNDIETVKLSDDYNDPWKYENDAETYIYTFTRDDDGYHLKSIKYTK